MLRLGTIAFLLGVIVLHNLSQLPASGIIWILATIALGGLLIRKRYFAGLSLFLIGFIWAYLQAAYLLTKQLPEDYIGRDIRVIGYIASLPEHDQRRQRFEFDITDSQALPQLHAARVRLSWYGTPPSMLQVGEKWQLTVRLKPPRNFASPGAFDYAGWLYQRGILNVGYVRTQADNQRLAQHSLLYPIQHLRQQLQQRLMATLQQREYAPLIRALAMGDRSSMDTAMWSTLQKTGTSHLMAISGLHIGLMSGVMFFLARFCWSGSVMLSLWCAAPRAAAIMAWFAAGFYAMLAGFAIPTQRALIMLTVVLLAVFARRQWRSINVLCIALLVVVLFNSRAVLSASFWLSFGAVGLIFYLIQLQPLQQRRIWRWWHLQLALSLGLIPLTVLFFQQASIVSPIANLIAIPVVSFILIPLIFIGIFCLLFSASFAAIVFAGVDTVFAYLWYWLQWSAQLPFAMVHLTVSSNISFVLAVLGVLLMLLPGMLRLRWVGAVLLLPLCLPRYDVIPNGEARLAVLDVGQGLATVIQTRQHVLVFDTGARFSPQFDVGNAVVLPYLRTQGIKQLDLLMVSHGDNDHVGGAASILNQLPVKQIISSEPAKLAQHQVKNCVAGMQWQWDEVTFEILYPDISDYAAGLSGNDLSCVMQIRTASQRILLTGDIEKQAEAKLVARFAEQLHSQVLVVPHHGSKTSSSATFLNVVRPNTAIVPVGWRNRYGFPHPSVVSRYATAGIRLYQTAQTGTMLFDTAKRQWLAYSEQQSHYWEWRKR